MLPSYDLATTNHLMVIDRATHLRSQDATGRGAVGLRQRVRLAPLAGKRRLRRRLAGGHRRVLARAQSHGAGPLRLRLPLHACPSQRYVQEPWNKGRSCVELLGKPIFVIDAKDESICAAFCRQIRSSEPKVRLSSVRMCAATLACVDLSESIFVVNMMIHSRQSLPLLYSRPPRLLRKMKLFV